MQPMVEEPTEVPDLMAALEAEPRRARRQAGGRKAPAEGERSRAGEEAGGEKAGRKEDAGEEAAAARPSGRRPAPAPSS